MAIVLCAIADSLRFDCQSVSDNLENYSKLSRDLRHGTGCGILVSTHSAYRECPKFRAVQTTRHPNRLMLKFTGSAIRGLKVHPDGEHIVYPMGNKVCIQEWKTKKMYFLSGHSNSVSTVAVSPKGTYVGSGQINHIGFKAATKLWDFKKKALLGSHELHKVGGCLIISTSFLAMSTLTAHL